MPILRVQDNLQDPARGCKKSQAKMTSTVEVEVTLESEKLASDLFKVLNPEVKADSRVKTSISQSKNLVSLNVFASDRTALRSTVNSYARWIRIYEEIGGIM
jgi:tRNA threonylcarbamoyladenosine modification (KEOPS) complex  Pcc1 subunit